MPRFWDFSIPTQIQFGRGGLRRLGQFAGSLGASVLLVGYEDRTGLEPVYAKAEKLLDKAGLKTTSCYTIPPDPPADIVENGAETARQVEADVIIGLGGGSVIDAAKGIAALVRLGGCLWDHTGANPQSKPILDSLPVLAVPTTAGTGSEVSNVAVFTHRPNGSTQATPIKDALFGPALCPTLALVDSELTVSSPLLLTAACAADALGHAIESCLSRRATPFATALALHAVSLITENLPLAIDDPQAPEPRESLALAATMAGAAFSAAGVVVSHAVAQALGAVLHLSHGQSVALATRQGLVYNRSTCTAEYAQLARSCGLQADSDEVLADRFVDIVNDLLNRCGLPQTVPAPADAPDDLIDQLVRNAYDSAPVPITQNPRRVSEEDMRALFESIIQ